jgi:hypothetical protein
MGSLLRSEFSKLTKIIILHTGLILHEKEILFKAFMVW